MPTATAPLQFKISPAKILGVGKHAVSGEGIIANYKGKQVGIIRPCVYTTTMGVVPGYKAVTEDGDVILVRESELSEPFIKFQEFTWSINPVSEDAVREA
jgi:hypothetical protein